MALLAWADEGFGFGDAAVDTAQCLFRPLRFQKYYYLPTESGFNVT